MNTTDRLGVLQGRAAGILFGLVALFVLSFGVLRIYQHDWLIFYTEAPVLVSLTAMLRDGSIAAGYPADGWASPPLILTLYPPVWFVVAGALTALTGSEGSYLAPRLLSLLAAVAVVSMLFQMARTRSVSPTWFLVLVGAWLISPATYNLVGAAQVDFLALWFTVTGVWLVHRGESGDRAVPGSLSQPEVAALLVLFGLAFFTKQSFVSAPAALVLILLIRRRFGAAVVLTAGFAAIVGVGTLALQEVTDGGYLANTFGALVGGVDVRNLTASLGYSAVWQWGVLLALVLLVVGDRLRPGFAELYVVISWTLNVSAMLKTGSSVNYLLEPIAALVILAIVRGAPDGPRTALRSERPWLARTLLVGLTIGSGWLVWGQMAVVPGLAGERLEWNLVDLDGALPLVDARFFPAVMQAGAMPYVNDPFAFGGLTERDAWTPAGLSEDLASHRVPYILTNVDLRIGPAPPELGTVDLLFLYFWLIPAIRNPIVEGYTLATEASPWLWLPETSP